MKVSSEGGCEIQRKHFFIVEDSSRSVYVTKHHRREYKFDKHTQIQYAYHHVLKVVINKKEKEQWQRITKSINIH